MSDLKLISIKCHRTEDWFGADEIILIINKKRVWGPVKMDRNDIKDLSGISTIPFCGRIRIDLFDKDVGWIDEDDHLGSTYAYSSQAGRGIQEHHFKGDGAHYTLLYSVVESSCVTTVFVVRHAEYDSMPGTPIPGPSLNAAGIDRRDHLVKVLCRVNIDAIYASQYLRTQETAQGVADKKTLNIVTDLSVSEQIDQIKTNHVGGCVLVVGHSNTVPDLITGLVPGSPLVNIQNEFHNIFIISLWPSYKAKILNLWYGNSPECSD